MHRPHQRPRLDAVSARCATGPPGSPTAAATAPRVGAPTPTADRGGYQGRDDRGTSVATRARSVTTVRPSGGYQGRNDRGTSGGYQGQKRDDRGTRVGTRVATTVAPPVVTRARRRDDRASRGGYQGRNDRGTPVGTRARSGTTAAAAGTRVATTVAPPVATRVERPGTSGGYSGA